MQLSLFTEGRNIDFVVPDNQGTVFIQSCKNLLIQEGISPEDIARMDNNKVVRKAVGSMDYNNWHKATRTDRNVKVVSIDDRIIEQDKDPELPHSPSAEDEFLAYEETERVKTTISRLLSQGQADVFYLHAISGLTFDQIGKKLSKKPDTCAHSYYDAVKNLKKHESDLKNEHFPWLTT